MAITARTNLRGRLGVLIAGSLVVTALTAGTAAASVPTPMGMAAPSRPARRGSQPQLPSPHPGPRVPAGARPLHPLRRARRRSADQRPGHQQPRGDRGKYTDAAGVQHGFRRDTHGRFTTIDVPGAPRNAVTGLNDRGQLVGFYENPDAAPSP